MTSTRNLRNAAGVLVLLGGLAACGNDAGTSAAAPAYDSSASSSSTTTTTTSAAPDSGSAAPVLADGSIDAADQTSDGRTMVVQSVSLAGIDHGFIGVHADLDGKPGPVVGAAKISGGTTGDVTVTFDKPVPTGAYWPMLHVDDHTIGTYEFPAVAGADLPVKSGGEVVMKKVTVTVG
ncbi:hypothetical protein SAMN05661080_02960 [Modestobacter sp. DSM 44400]|uniref:DUF7282 domain-containing protein n=1 Tax=Modestobacter sp. DSM 44400 TaxID=1550230 RepID=UPI00089709B9|nr:hypothetical protein [Modestobacter sp. DSM 44400]SDY28503.1 hypothetical protein SAMN05661080_02960 [Modestobacter sp. DSM 44400]